MLSMVRSMPIGMPKDRTNQAKWNGRRGNQGLCVEDGAIRPIGIQRQFNMVSCYHAAHLARKRSSRILCQQRWQIFLIKCPNDLCRVGLCGVHICRILMALRRSTLSMKKTPFPTAVWQPPPEALHDHQGADHHGFQCGYPGSIDL